MRRSWANTAQRGLFLGLALGGLFFPLASAQQPAKSACAAPPGPRSACEDGDCLYCQLCERGLFALGEPGQVTPPPVGWTVVLPPLPPAPPAPGTTPPPKPPMPWKPLFFENDFSYVDDPSSPYSNTFDFLKRRGLLNEAVRFDFGGEFRWQSRGEDNRRLTGEQNNFNLFRERLYLDTHVDDRFRMYWEVYWADGSEQTVPPVFIDLDHGDVSNAFGEVELWQRETGAWSFRYGWHEELLFGNQRLVSPLDWANVRRTFDMIPHLLYRGKDWSVDAFWSRPNIIRTRELNIPNYDSQFFGGYFSYKGLPQRIYDLYYLGLLSEEQNDVALNGELGEYQAHTLGFRIAGEEDNWLWEVESAYQFGQHENAALGRNQDRNAGMATAGFGRRFASMVFKPELWFYYDYASGTQAPLAGSYSTFNQLFPLGHKYLGYMDIVGRQNILAPNLNLKLYLNKRMNLLFWYYNFQLASARDALYNAAGAVSRRDPTGGAGRDVGNELDIALNIIVNPNADWQLGFAQFWSGPFIQHTADNPASAANGSFFYTQFTFRF